MHSLATEGEYVMGDIGCKKQYEDVCKSEFTSIKTSLGELSESVTRLSDKLFKSNGQRALVEIIRDNTEGRKRLESEVDILTKNMASLQDVVEKAVNVSSAKQVESTQDFNSITWSASFKHMLKQSPFASALVIIAIIFWLAMSGVKPQAVLPCLATADTPHTTAARP